jgi:predicted secreted hydrolase
MNSAKQVSCFKSNMKKSSLLYIGLFILIPLSAFGQEWRDVAPGDFMRLPADLFFRQDYRIQWWYFTGHLYDAAGREFGYELTFFAAGVQKRKYESKFGVDTVYISNFAVTDVQASKYYHFSDADIGAYGFAGANSDRLRVWVDKDSLEGTMNRMHLVASADDIGIDLSLVPVKPAILNGIRGYSRKSEESPLIASLYFSTTDLETQGILELDGTSLHVKGKSWFDREISSRGLAKNEEGWDWFALQLDDGREIMLYVIRETDGSIDPYSSGTFVRKDGHYRHLEHDEFTVRVLGHYVSEHTGSRYPSKWEISIPSENLRLVITPMIVDQEFTAANAMGTSYWEGTCRIDGDARGRAYVELTGY